MQSSLSTQIIGLAGLCQAVSLLQSLARHNKLEPELYETTLASIANLNPESPLAVYGNDITRLRDGLQIIVTQLGDGTKRDVEFTRYLVGVLALERKLNKNRGNMTELGKQLGQLERQLQHFAVTDETIVGRLADIYSDCISSLGSRIQVYGQPDVLKQTAVQQKVRALLLAAVRAAVLWRQAGGSRLHFIFQRRKLVAAAKHMLAQTTP
ncbi:high frequency lysogenization protein [Arsukibacterium tuosuense]|uniref:High frequency lysogenization protein HflD homolog n=1 Tax=Arsukibacterium tuosuense TaxID=1323745 RepID=A0A285IT31_9GAMM|nr:high frequency lysogenization protein HflD [Arsukibacterium tuosuense]SNY51148.1 high frequency lysogenization protein [Arsukibacterium tuosuense]